MIAKLQDTGSELMLPDIKYYQEFGGEKIIFEKEETSKIKKIIDQGNCDKHILVCLLAYWV